MKWSSGKDGSIEIELINGAEILFENLDELNRFISELIDIWNAAIKAEKENQE